MTALAGLHRLDGAPDAAEACARMLATQAIYGPGHNAQWSQDAVALGRRLARLLPEDAFDRQPLRSADGEIVLVADVRLDNRDEICTALSLPAGRAAQSSDADVLFAAWQRWADGCVARLIGDFAFAVWDARKRRFVLARDAVGARPLHYHRGPRLIAFASMPKGLHALPEIPRAADDEQLALEMITLRQTGRGTAFKDIARVEPGHIVELTADATLSRRYWTPQREVLRLRDADAYAEACREQLDRAVRCRLRGVNRVATHLSSGLDSPAVTATAARLLAGSNGHVTAFTAVPRADYEQPAPRNRIGDEGPLAALTAARYPNIEHVLIRTGDLSPLDGIDRGFFLYERPVPNICNMPWYEAINDAARERKLTVLLSAGLGNLTMSYAGLALLAEWARAWRLIALSRQLRLLVRNGDMRWRGALWATLSPFVSRSLWLWVNRRFADMDLDPLRWTAIQPERLARLLLLAQERQLDVPSRPARDGFTQRTDWLCHNDSGNMRKGMLAGWGIDHRDPMGDRRLIEFCLSVPTDQFLRDGVQRALARRTLADRIPQQVLAARARGLQAVDWHEMLTRSRDRIGDEVDRLAACAPAAQLLDLPRMRTLVDKWPKDGWERNDTILSYRIALLRGISVGHFLRCAGGANG